MIDRNIDVTNVRGHVPDRSLRAYIAQAEFRQATRMKREQRENGAKKIGKKTETKELPRAGGKVLDEEDTPEKISKRGYLVPKARESWEKPIRISDTVFAVPLAREVGW